MISDLSSRKWYEAQLQERARLSEMLAEIGAVLTREGSTEAMLQGCTSVLSRHLDALVQIWIVDPETGRSEDRWPSRGLQDVSVEDIGRRSSTESSPTGSAEFEEAGPAGARPGARPGKRMPTS